MPEIPESPFTYCILAWLGVPVVAGAVIALPSSTADEHHQLPDYFFFHHETAFAKTLRILTSGRVGRAVSSSIMPSVMRDDV